MEEIIISEKFRKHATRAAASIVLFIITYLLLAALAMAFVALCIFLGITVMGMGIGFITLMLGIGIVAMGILVFIFLFKFIFSYKKNDTSHLIEITEKDEPEFFKLLREIVTEVKTDFPKKVYLTAEVNASVFYDSSFWSMFFPVRKNLQIGLGLINGINKSEFKAILAHEFGHFSQKSMKVGSYVYNMNQVIYNLLNENGGYQSLLQGFANISQYFALFAIGAAKIIQFIQWILRGVYRVLNLNYLALSREMEFHADAVAAQVAGPRPLETGLLRMDLVDYAYHASLGFFNNKIDQCIRTKNIYSQHSFTMHFLAKESQIPVYENLPYVTIEHLNRYNKSKLVIKDQWASHPSTIDRIAELERRGTQTKPIDTNPAASLFVNLSHWQERLTEWIFSPVSYKKKPSDMSLEEYKSEYVKDFEKNSFDPVFNGYYDNKNPVGFSWEEEEHEADSRSELFDSTAIDLIYSGMAMENDLVLLRQIANKEIAIKSFDYDGKRYTCSQSSILIQQLEKELEVVNKKIAENDRHIFNHFLQLSVRMGEKDTMKEFFTGFSAGNADIEKKMEIYTEIANAVGFVQFTLPLEEIDRHMKDLKKLEPGYKNAIREILSNKAYENAFTPEAKINLEKYLSSNWQYFHDQVYQEEALSVLFTAMNDFQSTLIKIGIRAKKELLGFLARLEKLNPEPVR